jgi:hypothetical protein
MSILIPIGLVVSALLVLGYIIGTEMCLPTARHALRSGEMALWRLACGLVVAGEWSIIALCTSLLLIAEQTWHLFTVMQTGKLPGLVAAGLVTGVVFWEITGRTQKRYAGILSTSLNLILPASGRQRELYERLQQQLETGSVAEQHQIVQALLAQRDTRAD